MYCSSIHHWVQHLYTPEWSSSQECLPSITIILNPFMSFPHPLPSQFSSVLSLSHVWLFVTPWTATRQASLSIIISQNLFKLMSIKSVMPSNHCHSLLLLPSIFPNIKVFSNESILCIMWPKYWSFSFSISLFNEYSRLISFRLTGLISLQSKELSRVFSNTTGQNC